MCKLVLNSNKISVQQNQTIKSFPQVAFRNHDILTTLSLTEI